METTPAWRVHGLSCPPARHGHEAFPARGNPRRHVNHPCAAREDMCRQRRTAAKDATGPVTPGQEGNFFLGRSKALRYSAGTGRRAALSPAPYAERLGDIRKKRPSCLAGASTAGGKQRIGIRKEGGHERRFPRRRRSPAYGRQDLQTGGRKEWSPFLPPARRTVRRVKKFPQRKHRAEASAQRLPGKRPSSHATTAFSVRTAWRFKPYGPALHGKKTQFFPLGLGWATLCRRLVFPFSKGKTLSPATTREFFACRSQSAPAPPSESCREASP